MRDPGKYTWLSHEAPHIPRQSLSVGYLALVILATMMLFGLAWFASVIGLAGRRFLGWMAGG